MNKTLKRGRWRGLIKKEWALQKWTVIGIIATIFVITFLGISPVSAGLYNETIAKRIFSDNTWFILHMYMGVFLLFTSLINDLKRPDIWLHSTASARRLIEAKIVFASLAVTISLLLSGTLMGISAFKSGATWTEMMLFGGMIFLLALNALYLMAIAFFIWSIYHVLRSRIGKYSILVTFLFVMVSTITWAVIWTTDGIQKMIEFWPLLTLDVATSAYPYLHETNFILSGLMPEKALITVGSLFLYIVISLGVFIAGASLFEKKVRL